MCVLLQEAYISMLDGGIRKLVIVKAESEPNKQVPYFYRSSIGSGVCYSTEQLPDGPGG